MKGESAVRLVEKGYDKIHMCYSSQRIWRSNLKEVALLTKRMEKGASILDVGCGAGAIAKILSKNGFNVTGADISSNMLRLAKKALPKARFYKMDMRRLKLPKDSFDAITCFYAIIHVPRQYHLKVLKGFRRILKPSGLLLISMSTGPAEGTIADWQDWGAPMYWSQFGKRRNIQLVRKAGFKVLWNRVDSTGPKDDRHLYILAQKR